MNNSHEAFFEDIAVYALGALPPAQAAAVRKHLHECAQCRTEYDALRPAVNALAVSAESCEDPARGSVVASPLLKARIMKTVRAEARAPAGGRRGRGFIWPAYAVAAASIALALITTASSLVLRSDVSQTHDQLAGVQAQLGSANRTVAAQRLMLADLVSGDAKRYPVAGGEVIQRGGRIYIAMNAMPMPPKGHVYQAWTQSSGAKAMTPSVTFVPNHAGVAVVSLPSRANVAAVAVSVEPEGGSKAPTTKPEFVLKLG